MSSPAPAAAPITRDAALRIALAARAMPAITLPRLIEVLQDLIGDEIDCERLRKITVTDLKTGFGSLDGEEDGEDIGIGLEALKLAARILWGDTQEDENLPKIETYAEGDMPDSLRVALCSDSGNELNGHFGSCLRYLVYQVSATESRCIGIRDALEADFAADKNLFRTQLIDDCHVLYVVSMGGPAAAKVIRANIYPIKRIEGGPATEILSEFQGMMAGSPPPWMLKALGVAAEQRLKNYGAAPTDE